jgi:hypothetical protein
MTACRPRPNAQRSVDTEAIKAFGAELDIPCILKATTPQIPLGGRVKRDTTHQAVDAKLRAQ